jgi:dipeptidyl-peptidase-4
VTSRPTNSLTLPLTLERIFSDPDLNGPTPVALKFSPDGQRVTYLKAGSSNFEQLDLWEYHIASQQTRLLVEAASLETAGRVLSDAEKARRERKRITQSGIVEYFWAPDASAILFPLEGDLFLYHLDAAQPLQRLTDASTFETDLRFSPDGKYLSFVRDQNLYCIELASGELRQLTSDGGGTVSNGVAEFIAQEEMHRFDGYWWSPDSQAIAFIQVDESTVTLSQRYEIDADNFGVFDQRYPFAGTNNADTRLGVISLATGDRQWLAVPRATDSYLARVNWLQDSARLAIQVQARNQQQLDLLAWHRADNSFTTLLTETSNTWLNLHDCFTSLADGQRFVWASERTGFRHLYLYAVSGELLSTITSGPWVVASLQGVDEQKGQVYFEGFADTPLEKHLYSASLTAASQATRITASGMSHQVELHSDLAYFIDRYSAPNQPPAVSLNTIDGQVFNYMAANKLDTTHPCFPYLAQQGQVEFGELQAEDGQTLHYRLIKPPHLAAGATCPLLVTVYGGPGVQRVTNEWIPPWHHYMAGRGYGLLQLDNRGSSNRGKAFEDPIYGQLGVAEVQDQLTGVRYASNLPWVDAQRIGVFGHSYGGYMTLMLMMQAAGIFAAGVSVAPVTDWALYDSHYTERYLRLPADNAAGYLASSVFPYVTQLKGRLLVIHGMADDNVLFTNSTKLYKALQDNNIPFEIMNYPGAKHGLSGRKVNLHRYGMMDDFFDLHLAQHKPQ